jgi:Raf kinase inhibitor-like YbhB/YbcL family protein
MRQLLRLALIVLLGASALVAQQPPSGKFTLTSSAFASGATIPNKYTCKGEDISPALQWSGSPPNTAVFAIVMDDPDAPAGTWVHWVIWNIPATAQSLPEGVAKSAQLPDGARQGRNSFGKIGYNGPCPPSGQTHRYFFRIYALDGKANMMAGSPSAQLEGAMQGHILAQSEYMGTFHK